MEDARGKNYNGSYYGRCVEEGIPEDRLEGQRPILRPGAERGSNVAKEGGISAPTELVFSILQS